MRKKFTSFALTKHLRLEKLLLIIILLGNEVGRPMNAFNCEKFTTNEILFQENEEMSVTFSFADDRNGHGDPCFSCTPFL